MGICGGPRFETLNSLTGKQVHGVLAKSAVLWPQSLCPVCEMMLEEVENVVHAALLKIGHVWFFHFYLWLFLFLQTLYR